MHAKRFSGKKAGPALLPGPAVEEWSEVLLSGLLAFLFLFVAVRLWTFLFLPALGFLAGLSGLTMLALLSGLALLTALTLLAALRAVFFTLTIFFHTFPPIDNSA